MYIISAQQNTHEWLAERAKPNTYTASEANAMKGTSKYQSRTELLTLKKIGNFQEVSSSQQALFDKGHAAEEKARAIAEETIFGEELFPATGYIELDGLRLLASFDGITLGEDALFEHKLWNDQLADYVRSGGVPDTHYWQLEHQLLVSGANYVVFVVSDGTEQRMVQTTYYPVPGRREALIEGWKQFHKDLENYVPVKVVEPQKAEPIKDLPMVTVQVRGELTMCNLHDVTPMFDKFLQEAKTELVTDNDFAQAEAEAKLGRETAKRCKLTAKAVVDQMLSISEVTRTLEEYAAKFDALALKQEKLVKSEKEKRKSGIVAEAGNKFMAHFNDLQAEIDQVNLIVPQPDFASAIKGKKTLTSMRDAVDTMLANAKIEADSAANNIKSKLNWFNDAALDHKFLFNDLQQIIYKEQDDFMRLVIDRVNQHKKAEEERLKAECERLAQEAAIKLEQERQRIQSEEERKAQDKINAEKNRLAIEELVQKRVAAKQEFFKDVEKSEEFTLDADHKTFAPQEITDTAEDYVTVKPKHEQIIKIAVSAIAFAKFITTDEAKLFLFEAVKAELGI